MASHRTQRGSIAVADPTETEHAVDEREAAKIVDYTPAAMRLWRREGRGPAFIRVGRSIRYLPSDLRDWQRAHRVEPRGAR